MEVDTIVVKLKSNDGKFFQFSESEASCSRALRRMLECSRQYINGTSTNSTGPYILLQSIDSKVLSNIHQWSKMHCYHKAHREPDGLDRDRHDPSTSIAQASQETIDWDTKFLKSFSEFDLLKLMNAANFLDMESLYDACCRLMASRWEGMKVEEIRRKYRIQNDFSPEEEIQFMQDNKKLGLME